MGEGKGTPSIFLLQKGLHDSGHEVHLVIPAKEQSKSQTVEGINLHYFRIPLASTSSRNPTMHRLQIKLNWLFFVFFGWLKARAVAQEIKPDLVYGHTAYGAPIAYLIAKKLKIPNITRLYGTFLYPHLSTFWQRCKKIEEIIAFKTPCTLLMITDDGTKGDKVAKYLKVPMERVRFWMNGVDKNIFDPTFDATEFKKRIGVNPHNKIILSLSRLEHWKGVDRLVGAVPKIVQGRDDLIFLVIGDGSERESLEEMSRELGISDFVKFMGAIPSAEVAKYMNAADIFVSLQDYSNIGNPLLEAMTCGKCILALNTGDTSKIIKSGDTGILLDPENLQEELPKQILRLLDNESLRKELGKNARQFALDNFQTWDERIKMEIAEIENLCFQQK